MLRLVFFGVAFATLLTAGPRIASAEQSQVDETGTSATDTEDAAAAAPTANDTRARKHRRRSRRHPHVSGRVVPEETRRQDPLPRPSGNLHLVFPGVKDEAEVNIYNADRSYNLDRLEQTTPRLACPPTETGKP